MTVESHDSKNTSKSHLNKFYQTFPELEDQKYDGMIITGAPVEQMEFEEVDYWSELVKIMDWTKTHVTSTIIFVLGRTGRPLPSLWPKEKNASQENVWPFLA